VTRGRGLVRQAGERTRQRRKPCVRPENRAVVIPIC